MNWFDDSGFETSCWRGLSNCRPPSHRTRKHNHVLETFALRFVLIWKPTERRWQFYWSFKTIIKHIFLFVISSLIDMMVTNTPKGLFYHRRFRGHWLIMCIIFQSLCTTECLTYRRSFLNQCLFVRKILFHKCSYLLDMFFFNFVI